MAGWIFANTVSKHGDESVIRNYVKNQGSDGKYIPVPLEDARFRKSERFILKAHFLSRVVPL